MVEATDPQTAAELLREHYGFSDDKVVAGGDFIAVEGDGDANNPLGGVLYAVNDIGWRAVSVKTEPDNPSVMAQPVSPGEAPGWMRLTMDRVVRRDRD